MSTATAITATKPPSILALQETHVSRSNVASMCLNQFHYPAYYRSTLDSYYILHWSGEYFMDQLEDGMICGDVGGHSYLVIYQGCTPFQVRRAGKKQVRLSFRHALPVFNLPGYVIVRLESKLLAA